VVSVFVATMLGVFRAMTKTYTKKLNADLNKKELSSADEIMGGEGSDKADEKLADPPCAPKEPKQKGLRAAAEGERPSVVQVDLELHRPRSAPNSSKSDSWKMRQQINKSHVIDEDLIPARQRRQNESACREHDDVPDGPRAAANCFRGQTLHPQQAQQAQQVSKKKIRHLCSKTESGS